MTASKRPDDRAARERRIPNVGWSPSALVIVEEVSEADWIIRTDLSGPPRHLATCEQAVRAARLWLIEQRGGTVIVTNRHGRILQRQLITLTSPLDPPTDPCPNGH